MVFRGRTKRGRRLWEVGGGALLCLLLACQPDPNTPRGTAELFLDAHYVEMDLQAAKAFCSGLALHKVEEEIRLTQGQTIDETTRRPSVHYHLVEERSRNPNQASLLYEATISVPGAGQLKRKWLLSLRREEEGWKVRNYTEFFD